MSLVRRSSIRQEILDLPSGELRQVLKELISANLGVEGIGYIREGVSELWYRRKEKERGKEEKERVIGMRWGEKRKE